MEQNPNVAEIHVLLGQAYADNDFHNALASLERIPRTQRPDSALPLLAASYLGLGRIPEAQVLGADVTRRAEKNPRLRVDFAEVLLDFDLVNDALTLLQIAEKQQPPSTEVFFALGRARERKGDVALAQKDLERAVDLNPASIDALQALARILAGEGQWEKSVEFLSRAQKIAPDSPDVLRKLSTANLQVAARRAGGFVLAWGGATPERGYRGRTRFAGELRKVTASGFAGVSGVRDAASLSAGLPARPG